MAADLINRQKQDGQKKTKRIQECARSVVTLEVSSAERRVVCAE